MTKLTTQQNLATTHFEGPALVIAGAGSGKTRVVTLRILHLLQLGVPASAILALTFTNKAAQEMRERIQHLSKNFVLTSTFHSLCARILRESITALGFLPEFHIYDEDDTDKLLKQCLQTLGLKEDKAIFKTIRAAISSFKNNLVKPEAVEKEDLALAQIYALYQAKLKEYGALDFDDLLFLTIQLFEQFPEILAKYQDRWTFILVDEYQDTNSAQHRLLLYLCAKHCNLFAVGDPDQSIYSWRGANIGNILQFEKDFPGAKIIPLEQNFRSHTHILNAANGLISHNPSQYKKHLWSDLGPGSKITLFIGESDRAEADFVVNQIHKLSSLNLKECVIFYRTNFQSRTMEDALLRERIPYKIIGGLSFYERKEIKDILSLLRLSLSPFDFISFGRMINLPRRGLGDAAIEKLKEISSKEKKSILETVEGIIQGRFECRLSAKQKEGLKEFSSCLSCLQEMVRLKTPLKTIVSEAIDRSSYLKHLKEDPETYEERRSNLAELVSKAAEWEETREEEATLSKFLEELALQSSHEEVESHEDAVSLMTLHNGKGLEFKNVFLIGMEEDLLPHINAKDSEEKIQEERRLCYVGITRAKERLFLTAARFRFLWGIPRKMFPSRFLNEIPPEDLEAFSPLSQRGEEETLTFSTGDTVFHRDFGTGTIQKKYDTSLGVTYDVFFEEAQTIRSLVAKYARLKAVVR